ncbi:hypothetical protein COB11_04660 [Candidatus Aerophobetes bacterium]|uniref:SPOR domain-containing protein n=1 Tax=Aerophobetes bacterium TaxID=2030807 RepID=A0A2A4YHD1_UNCAE|nr:MAG: hypothetical protein COB11_04660 [Candidatus Aerophobetes bacterium]
MKQDNMQKDSEKIYLLYYYFEHENGQEDYVLKGVFSSRQKAEKELKDFGKFPEFKKILSRFAIYEFMIDDIVWPGGFVTVD